MQIRAPAIDRESYHSLRFWAEYLMRRRAAEGRPMPAALAGQLRHHVISRLFQDWNIQLRYRPVPLTEAQAWRVYNDVLWVRQNRDLLWR